MAKSQKQQSSKKPAQAVVKPTVAQAVQHAVGMPRGTVPTVAVTQNATTAQKQPAAQQATLKLTKRNSTPLTQVLYATGKAPKIRAAHNVAAWQAVSAALPAPAAVLASLQGVNWAACVSGPAYISYMQRRGYLSSTPQPQAQPAPKAGKGKRAK